MSWQSCPHCQGSGMGSAYGIKCPVCDGKYIINEANGKPPSEEEKGEVKP